MEFRPQQSLRLFALWGRLHRVDPRALPVPAAPECPPTPLSQAFSFLHDHATLLSEAIDSIATAQANGWLDRAGRLKDSYHDEGGISPAERESEAKSLLLELDDLELAHYCSSHLDQPHAPLRESAHRCCRWLSQNVHAFLAGKKTIESELRLMRRDLPTADASLSQTTHKYLQIRRAIEEMEEELTFPPLPACLK